MTVLKKNKLDLTKIRAGHSSRARTTQVFDPAGVWTPMNPNDGPWVQMHTLTTTQRARRLPTHGNATGGALVWKGGGARGGAKD